MKIINQFRKLHEGSKIALRFRKYPTEVFCETGMLAFGIKIVLTNGLPLGKEYEKFTLNTEPSNNDIAVFMNMCFFS